MKGMYLYISHGSNAGDYLGNVTVHRLTSKDGLLVEMYRIECKKDCKRGQGEKK